jgi:hypothetical protein
METEEQTLRKLEKSTANAHGAFALGLFSTALWTYSVKPDFRWIILSVLGGVFLLSGFHFWIIHKWNRKKVIDLASAIGIDYVSWLLALIALGVGLIQTKLNWAAIPGEWCIYVGYIVLVTGIWKALKSLKKSRKTHD